MNLISYFFEREGELSPARPFKQPLCYFMKSLTNVQNSVPYKSS